MSIVLRPRRRIVLQHCIDAGQLCGQHNPRLL